ncbi:MAG: WbuC family cupin fold metalloprotein [Bacteroidaceae bacterium]|nr:WbuC family cupin fold metalloprotein [Bacteroidaceae bacterium]
MDIELITSELLDEVSAQAKTNARLRMNHNFHKSLDDKVHRFLNALEPSTVMDIHRHDEDESYVVLRGAVTALFYDTEGNLMESHTLNPSEGTFGVNIPAGTYHSLEVLESNTVLFEVREGPFKKHIPLGK